MFERDYFVICGVIALAMCGTFFIGGNRIPSLNASPRAAYKAAGPAKDRDTFQRQVRESNPPKGYIEPLKLHGRCSPSFFALGCFASLVFVAHVMLAVGGDSQLVRITCQWFLTVGYCVVFVDLLIRQ